MKILVTGGTGFIGARLVDRLLKEGHEVVCTVRKTSKTGSLKEKGVELVLAEVANGSDVERAFREVRPEIVFHCAANVMSKDEESLFRANAQGTRNICQASLNHGVQRLIYASSVAVVSGNPDSPLTDELPYKATCFYGKSKIEAERIAIDFRDKGLKVAIVRPCMVYGEDEPHLLYKILDLIAKRRIPMVDAEGVHAKLNLVYVDNVVEVLMLAFKKDEALKGTFMVADKEIITLKEFLEVLYNLVGSGKPPVIPGWLCRLALKIPPIRRRAERFFKNRVYDITRAQDILGYNPAVSTEEGLKVTVEHWKKTCQK